MGSFCVPCINCMAYTYIRKDTLFAKKNEMYFASNANRQVHSKITIAATAFSFLSRIRVP